MKKITVLAALTAASLTAAATTPALALENEFHGLFSARYINSNFNRTATTDYGPGDGTYDPTGTTKKQYSANFVEQRARLQYIAKANADLKLVTQFELDYAYWGNSSYTVARNGGAALGADTVNIETKSIYLDANPFKNINMKLGMMPNNDAFKGILFDADMAGVLLSSSYGKFTPSIGYFRFNDKGSVDKVLGHKTNDLFMLDGKYEISKHLKVGAAYYFFRDNQSNGSTVTGVLPIVGYDSKGNAIYTSTVTTAKPDNDVKIHVLGLNGEYSNGPLTLNGFFVYETGWNNTLTKTKTYVNSIAANAGAKLKAGPGTASAEFLYVMGSGNNGKNAFYSVDGEHGYYDNEMVLLGRDKNAYTTDNSILFNAGNKGQGQIGTYFGYSMPVNAKLDAAANVGFAWIARKNGNSFKNASTSAPNGSNFLGTEINAEATYKLLEGFSAGVRAGYAILGGHFDNVATNGTPENPYDFKLIFKYTF